MASNTDSSTVKTVKWLRQFLIVSVSTGCIVFLGNGCQQFEALNSAQLSSGLNDHREPVKLNKGWACEISRRGLTENTSRRLTKDEITASLKSIFGDTDVVETPEVRSALVFLPTEPPFSQSLKFDNQIKDVEGLMSVAEAVANTVMAQSAVVTRVLGCNPTTNLSLCQTNLADNLARRVLRRPLTTGTGGEREELLNFMKQIGGKDGLEFAIIRLIVSPSFHQMFELDDRAVMGNRARLSQYEIATRLAFRITGTSPDNTLLDAAAEGKLDTLEQVRAQGLRLIATSQAKNKLHAMIINWLGLANVPDPDAFIANLQGISDVTGLGQEAFTEFHRFVDDVVFNRNGTFKDLLTDKTIFPSTDRLAKIYNVARSNASVRTTGPHGGILVRAATLMSSRPVSDPISRGVYFRKQILCQSLASPPNNIIEERRMTLGELSHVAYSNRQIVEMMTAGSACMGCHSMINPLGFALEGFGPLGEARTKERIVGSAGEVIAEHPINTQVGDLVLGSRTPSAVSNAAEMTQMIADSETGLACFTQQIFAQSRYRFPEENDGCALNDIRKPLSENKSIKEALIENLANEDIFWRRLE